MNFFKYFAFFLALQLWSVTLSPLRNDFELKSQKSLRNRQNSSLFDSFVDRIKNMDKRLLLIPVLLTTLVTAYFFADQADDQSKLANNDAIKFAHNVAEGRLTDEFVRTYKKTTKRSALVSSFEIKANDVSLPVLPDGEKWFFTKVPSKKTPGTISCKVGRWKRRGRDKLFASSGVVVVAGEYIYLAANNSGNQIADFGGVIDFDGKEKFIDTSKKDARVKHSHEARNYLFDTASRELIEESDGLFWLKNEDLHNLPFVDQYQHRTYVVVLPEDFNDMPIEEINEKFKQNLENVQNAGAKSCWQEVSEIKKLKISEVTPGANNICKRLQNVISVLKSGKYSYTKADGKVVTIEIKIDTIQPNCTVKLVTKELPF